MPAPLRFARPGIFNLIIMEVIAIAKNVRLSPKKVRLVVDQIKKLKPQDAVKILDFVPKGSSAILKKVISSAIANARNNNNLPEDTLVFKQIQVGKGVVFKRYRPVARGRAHSILKRTSHIKVVLEGEEKRQPKSNQSPENNNTSDNSKIKNKKSK